MLPSSTFKKTITVCGGGSLEYLRRISVQHQDDYTRGLAIVYIYGKQYDKAVPLLNSLLGKYINDPEIHFFLGCTYAALEKPEEAHFEFEKALALKKDYFEAWEHLYLLAVHEKDLDAALAVARRFAGSFPDHSGAWRLVGSSSACARSTAPPVPHCPRRLPWTVPMLRHGSISEAALNGIMIFSMPPLLSKEFLSSSPPILRLPIILAICGRIEA